MVRLRYPFVFGTFWILHAGLEGNGTKEISITPTTSGWNGMHRKLSATSHRGKYRDERIRMIPSLIVNLQELE